MSSVDLFTSHLPTWGEGVGLGGDLALPLVRTNLHSPFAHAMNSAPGLHALRVETRTAIHVYADACDS